MLNDYTGNRMSISSLNEFTESLDRVTLTCSLSHLHLVICDMSDLYDDPHYIVSHQLKVNHDFDIKVLIFVIPNL